MKSLFSCVFLCLCFLMVAEASPYNSEYQVFFLPVRLWNVWRFAFCVLQSTGGLAKTSSAPSGRNASWKGTSATPTPISAGLIPRARGRLDKAPQDARLWDALRDTSAPSGKRPATDLLVRSNRPALHSGRPVLTEHRPRTVSLIFFI